MRHVFRRMGRGGRALLVVTGMLVVGVVVLVQAGIVPDALTGTASNSRTLTFTPSTGGALEWEAYGGGSGVVGLQRCGATASGTATKCSVTASHGTAISITAVPLAGKQFVGWTGMCGTGVPNMVVASGQGCSMALGGNWTVGATMGQERSDISTMGATQNGTGQVGVRNNVSGGTEDRIYQTFTATTTGALIGASWKSIELAIVAGQGSFDLQFDIVGVDAAGKPTENVLATAWDRGLDHNLRTGARRVNFTTSPTLTAGQKYALRVSCVNCSGGKYARVGMMSDTYPGGEYWRWSKTTTTLTFSTDSRSLDLQFAIHTFN